jgi:hypothetical protein
MCVHWPHELPTLFVHCTIHARHCFACIYWSHELPTLFIYWTHEPPHCSREDCSCAYAGHTNYRHCSYVVLFTRGAVRVHILVTRTTDTVHASCPCAHTGHTNYPALFVHCSRELSMCAYWSHELPGTVRTVFDDVAWLAALQILHWGGTVHAVLFTWNTVHITVLFMRCCRCA